MARTKKAATKTTVKTASISETPAKSVVTASEEKAVKAETPKTDDAKASVETKKAAETPAEKKADTKPAEEKTAAVKTEEPVKKPAAKKTTARKAPAKKVVAKKEVSADVYVQFMGRELLTKEIVANVKKAWAGMTGKKEEDIKELQVYVKPEENKAYYVVNGEADGNYIDL